MVTYGFRDWQLTLDTNEAHQFITKMKYYVGW